MLEGNGVPEDSHGGENKEDILENTGHGEDYGGGFTDLQHYQHCDFVINLTKGAHQENDGHVEQERNHRVSNQGPETQAVDISHGHARGFSEESDNAVCHGACGRVVVQRDQRVHLEFGRAEEALDHDEAKGFEDDTTDLDC